MDSSDEIALIDGIIHPDEQICVRNAHLLKVNDGGDKFRKMLENLNDDEQLEEMERCTMSFQYWAENYVWITHPKRGLIRFRLYPYQIRCINDYDKYKHNIIRKFRQGGLTTLTTIWAAWRCMFKSDQKFMVLSKSDREAKSAGKIVTNILKYLPTWMQPDVELDNQHEKVFRDTNGSLEFWTAEAARSKSLTYLIIDEAAFIKNMDDHWKSMYPTLATGGSCIVISTVNGLGNWYEEWYHAAAQGKNEFHVIELEYTENPEYNNAQWVREMKANLGDKGWRQEVLGDFLGSGQTYINGEALARLAKSTGRTPPIIKKFPEWENDDTGAHEDWKMISSEYNKGAMWIWQEPQDGVEYTISADVSHGVGEDNSAFMIFREDTMEQVGEFYSNSIPANDFAQVLYAVGKAYKNALIVIEAAEQGYAVINKLQNSWLNYDNLYYETKKNNETAGVRVDKTSRPLFMDHLQSYLHNDMIKVKSSRLIRELKTFVVKNNKPQAQKGKHDDLVMCLAIFLGILDTRHRNLPVGGGNEGNEQTIDLTRTDLFARIRDELENGLVEQLLAGMEEEDQELDEAGMMGRVMHDIVRPHDPILREFDW